MLLSGMALSGSATAQTTPAPPAATRTVVAATKLPTVTDAPLYFKAVSATLPPGEKSAISGGNGVLYQVSGSTEVSLGGEAKLLNAGEGLFIANGKVAELKASSGAPSIFLHFALAPGVALDRSATTSPAAVKDLYRTAAPIPNLKPGMISI
jgi:quercetin dioxygenase-like cupin family protein